MRSSRPAYHNLKCDQYTVYPGTSKIMAGYAELTEGPRAFGMRSAELKLAAPGDWVPETIATTR